MKWRSRIICVLAIGFALPAFAASQAAAAQGTRPVALFYMTNDPNSIRDFFAFVADRPAGAGLVPGG